MTTTLPSLSQEVTDALRTYLSGNKLTYQQVGQLVSRLKSVNPSTLESLVVGAGAIVAAGANPFEQFVHESLQPDRSVHHTPINEKFDFKIGEGGKIVIGKEQPPTKSMTDIFTEDQIKQSMNNLLRKLRTASAQQREKERIDPELKAQIKSNIEEIRDAGTPKTTLAKSIRDAIGTTIDGTTALTVVGMMDSVYSKPAIKPSAGDTSKPDTGKETTDIPIPTIGTDTTGKGPKTKPTGPREPGEDEPKPIPELKPSKPSVPKVADPLPRRKLKGRYRPRFKRHNNVHSLKPNDDRDDLFGDDIDEMELAMLELNTQLNKFGAFDQKDTPGRRAELMDDALRFFGQTETYQTGADHRGYFFHPDYGFVHQKVDEYGNDLNPFIYQGVDNRCSFDDDITNIRTMVESSEVPIY